MQDYFCPRCSVKHTIYYTKHANGFPCLMVDCPKWNYGIKLVLGLKIETRLTGKQKRAEKRLRREKQQPGLF